MASIKRRRTTSGESRYDVRYRTPAGEARVKTWRTRREAEKFANTVEADKLRGLWVDPRHGRVTVRAYAEEWMNHRPALRVRTRETYEAQLRLHVYPTFGDVELSKVTPNAIRSWHAGISRDISSSMAAKCYRLLRAILNTAASDELILRNPCRIEGAGVEKPAERPQATAAQVLELAAAMPDRYRALVLLAGFVGLRLGELLGLRCRHVNLLHGTLTVEQQEIQLNDATLVVVPPKTAAGFRVIALPAFLLPELEAHLSRFADPRPDGRLFRGEKGGPLRRQVLHGYWTTARGKVDVPAGFRFHDLRHTANTLAASTGASLKELMYRMGHASPAAALRYQHATRERDAAIAQALDEQIVRAGAHERGSLAGSLSSGSNG